MFLPNEMHYIQLLERIGCRITGATCQYKSACLHSGHVSREGHIYLSTEKWTGHLCHQISQFLI